MADTWDVELWVYDISQGFAGMMSSSLLGFHLEAIYHTSIVIYGVEYFFGGVARAEATAPTSGVQKCTPGATVLGQPMRKEFLGKTELDPDTFQLWLDEIGRTEYRGDTYSLFKHNCNNFSEDAAQFLGNTLHLAKIIQGQYRNQITSSNFTGVELHI